MSTYAHPEAHAPALPRGLRRLAADPVWRRWTGAWLGLPVIGVANGAIRERLYADRIGDRAAHGLSTATALIPFAGYTWLVHRRWPIPEPRTAAVIGATWLVLTVGFEFGFGRAVAGESWSALLRDYDLRSGHLWALVPAFLAAGPALARRLQGRGRALG